MKLSEENTKEKLKAYIGWEMHGDMIEKTYGFADFMSALDFVNKVGIIAEHHNHHPDILIHYTKVTFGISTHSEGGVTEQDFTLVREIEQLAATSV